MSELLITIAIPTYNNEKTIQSTIESCLDQDSDRAYEVLVVNNASKDETKKILEQYDDKKLRVIHNAETLSMYDNHNICLKNSHGKYVLFCHSDDTLETHAIKTLVKKIKERNYPDKYVLWGKSMIRDFSYTVARSGFALNAMIVGAYAPLLFMHGGLTPSGTCYSRESFLVHDGFLKTNHKLAPSDMTSMLNLAINGFRFEMMDEMIFLRTYASTMISGTTVEDILESLDDAFQQFFQIINNESIKKLLNLSTNLKHCPYAFYYAVSQDSRYKKYIKRLVIRRLMKNPTQLRYGIVRKLLSRLISK